MLEKLGLPVSIIIALVIGFLYFSSKPTSEGVVKSISEELSDEINEGGMEVLAPHPLSIEALRAGDYSGSELTIEQTLSAGSNYDRYIASYKSEGLKIFGLLTIPRDPSTNAQAFGSEAQARRDDNKKYPVVIFNHGYIPPDQYRTTERYIAYTDGFSRSGYILFRPDYRGHGNSEGEARGGYSSNDYTIDVLNAVASVKKLPEADENRIGMWGHSMGGHVTLRNMVVNKHVKAGVIWAGVVASYPDLLRNWRRGNGTPRPIPTGRRSWRNDLASQYGDPEENPEFWNSISANSYLGEISGPMQIHHGTADSSVPVEFSEKLDVELKTAGQTSELYLYNGDDHNLSSSFSLAMQRSIEFFDKYVKGI